MKKPQSSLSNIILLALFALLTQQYALEGSWSLTNHQDIKLDPSIDIEFQFTETITANLTISKTLVVHACYNLAYRYAVEDNNIYITFLNIIDIPRKCQSGEISTIRSKLETVFYFIINGTSLALYDPTGFAPFVFQNADSNVGPAINGGWQTLKINQNIQNSNVYINGSHAVLCNGNGVAIYNITSRSQVIFTILRSRGCDRASMDILSALDSTVFYRIRNNTYLYLYDYALTNVLQASMASFVGFRQSLAFVSQNVPENKSQNEPTVKNNSVQATVNNTVGDKTQVNITANSNSNKTTVSALTPSNQTQTAINQSEIIATTVSTPKAPTAANQSIGSPSNSSASALTNNSSPVLPASNSNATPISNPAPVLDATTVSNSTQISNSTPVSNLTSASNSLPTQVSATPSNQSSNTSSTPIQTQTLSSLTIQSNKSQQTSSPIPSSPPNEKTTVPPSPTPKRTISSISDLSALNSKLIDGKWFISALPGQNIASLKTYYFIANSVAKRFIMYGGCNVQFYLYTLNNNLIAFGTPTSTTKVCTPNNDPIVANPLFKNSAYLEAAAGTLTFYDSQFAQTIVLSNNPPS